VKRPRLDNGEPQPLETAEKFQFSHMPDLEIEDELRADVPVYVEALRVSVAGEERFADQKHVYASVKSTGFIDAKRAYFGSVELEGSNQTGQSTTSIPFVFTAVGAQYFTECQCQATDLLTGRQMQPPQLQGNRPIYVFPSHILFNEPVPPGQGFRVRVNFRLKMVMLEERDYDMISLVRFPRGVAKTEICLLSERTIVAPALWELRGNKLIRSGLPLEAVTAAPDNPAGKSAAKGYKANIDSPSSLAYLLYYERLA
jgi:hypothetical protein